MDVNHVILLLTTFGLYFNDRNCSLLRPNKEISMRRPISWLWKIVIVWMSVSRKATILCGFLILRLRMDATSRWLFHSIYLFFTNETCTILTKIQKQKTSKIIYWYDIVWYDQSLILSFIDATMADKFVALVSGSKEI